MQLAARSLITFVTLLAVGAAPAAATEARAPRLLNALYLGGANSGGRVAIVSVSLDREPRRLRVTIDGRAARIGGRVGGISLYQPTAPKGDTRPGRSYWVLVEATSKSGGTLRVHGRLYLHRGFTPGRR